MLEAAAGGCSHLQPALDIKDKRKTSLMQSIVETLTQ
jgi:hypothetical protein